MALRITGGQLGGRTLRTPRGASVRPTTGRVREALFSILGQNLDDLSVLDLCAGAGTLGIEAGSRGASRVVFVEQGSDHLRVLRENAALLQGHADIDVRRMDARRAPGLLSRQGETFDLVFLDPPYGRGLALEVVQALAEVAPTLLRSDATVVAETESAATLPETLGGLRRDEPRSYGDTKLWIYRADEAE
ncbi:MAG: 16S rRNA (guanine(966)-N(2))-methyltransferase RsmD [Deltaproteobacteria bacterium]|nr:16S rRNA (guanine(966)-N(2))-methyltransferase RsmD [Deltaproteobacteria bacterium]